jgi:hypothetical protein
LSTLTDLFNLRIGLGARSFFAEIAEKEILVLGAPDRLPLKTEVSLAFYSGTPLDSPFEGILRNEGVTKESVYCIIPPSSYYQNTLVFPFSERQKIESTIKFEVEEHLPLSETEYLTDFLVLGGGPGGGAGGKGGDGAGGGAGIGTSPGGGGSRGAAECGVLSFTARKEVVKKLLGAFGSFKENLKGVIPLGAAILFSARSVIDAPEFFCMDIQNDFTHVQHIRGFGIARSLSVRRTGDEQYRRSLSSGLLLLVKSAGGLPAGGPPLFLNTRSTATDDFRLLNAEVLKGLDLIPRNFPSHEFVGTGFHHTARRGEASDALSPPDLIAIMGGLLVQGQAPPRKVNLLKEEFKARPGGYIRIKDFMTLGAILLLLLAVSLFNLFVELGSARRENRELKQAISALNAKTFQKPNVQPKDALAELENMRNAIRRFEASIDRKSSGVELLRELSSFLPNDVALEFTDIIIERERVKFAGKARTFADIDRIKEALAASEYFSEVTVSNTGTTGSTEGFTVSFLFDIKVRTPGGDPKTALPAGGE